jgi:hypothetical protein
MMISSLSQAASGFVIEKQKMIEFYKSQVKKKVIK